MAHMRLASSTKTITRKHVSALFGKSEEILDVKVRTAYSNHCISCSGQRDTFSKKGHIASSHALFSATYLKYLFML
jgi:hypothetical protein